MRRIALNIFSTIVISLAGASVALASTAYTYTYIGGPYDHFNQDFFSANLLNNHNSLSASFTFDHQLEASRWSQVVTPIAWRVWDNTFEINSDEPGLALYHGGAGQYSALIGVDLSTDDAGRIYGWSFDAQKYWYNDLSTVPSYVHLGSNGCSIGCLNDDATSYFFGSPYGIASSYAGGRWEVVSAVPAPSAWRLILIALIVVSTFARTTSAAIVRR